jgi:hypothetical protein
MRPFFMIASQAKLAIRLTSRHAVSTSAYMNDAVGTNNFSVVGSPYYSSGKLGQCVRFDDVSQYMEITSNIAGNYDHKVFSLSFWIYIYGTQPSSDRPIITLQCQYPNSQNQWKVVMKSSGNSDYIGFNNCSWQYGESGPSVSSSYIGLYNWFHCVILKNDQYLTWYVNNTARITNYNLFRSLAYTGYKFIVGNEDGSDYYDGWLDQVAYWKRLLTATEIAQLYNSGNGLAFTSWT